LANLGSETVSIVVFENNIPISLEVLPMGSNDITNNIALKMKISLEDAEMVKKKPTSYNRLFRGETPGKPLI